MVELLDQDLLLRELRFHLAQQHLVALQLLAQLLLDLLLLVEFALVAHTAALRLAPCAVADRCPGAHLTFPDGAHRFDNDETRPQFALYHTRPGAGRRIWTKF